MIMTSRSGHMGFFLEKKKANILANYANEDEDENEEEFYFR